MNVRSVVLSLALLACADDPAATPEDVASLQDQIDGLSAALSDMATVNEDLAADLAATQAALDAAVARLDAAEGRLDGHDTDLDALEARLDAQDADLDGLTTTVGALDGDLADLRTDLEAVSGGITFTQLEDSLSDVDGRLAAVEASYASSTDVAAADAGLQGAIDANAGATAALDGRIATLETAGFATEAWVGAGYAATSTTDALDGRVTTLEDAGYATSTELTDGLDGLDGRLGALESLDLATETWVAGQGYASTADLGTTDAALGALDTRVGALEGLDLATETWVSSQGYASTADLGTTDDAVAALDARISAVEGAGYVTDAYVAAQDFAPNGAVNALEGRVSSLEGAGYATQAFVTGQGYASSASVTSIDGRVTALELGAQSYALATDVDALDLRLQAVETLDLVENTDLVGVQADLDLLLVDVSDLEGRVGTLETAGYATESFVTSQGYLTSAPDPFTIGAGLRLAGGELEVDAGAGLDFAGTTLVVDDVEIQNLARDVCYDTEAELLVDLDDDYLMGGADVDLGAGVQLGDSTATCDAANVGLVRFHNGAFEGCTASGWLPFLGASDGSSEAAAGESCASIHAEFPSRPSGVYWLRGASGATYQTYCDMVTDGGGWTLLGTINGGDADNWNTQFGYWSDTQTLGSASAPFADYKSAAWFDLDVTTAEVLYQRRHQDNVVANVRMTNVCLHGKQYFNELFTTWDTSLRCGNGQLTVLDSSSAGLIDGTYEEGAANGLGGSAANGWCWNGGDTVSNDFQGHAGWNQSVYSCYADGHLGYVGVFSNGDSQFENVDVTSTNWLSGGGDPDNTDLSFFVR
jgi:hypothetical protein